MREKRRLWYPLLLFILICIFFTACEQTPTRQSDSINTDHTNSSNITGTMEIHFLDVGQGDCTLIQCDGQTMLIDAGNNDKANDVRDYLISKGITQLNYVIGTHPDADHVGGLDVVIDTFDCQTIFMPNRTSNTRTYQDVIQSMQMRNETNTTPVVGTTYTLGSASFTIIAPNSNDYGENTNDYSIGILLQHGENRFLFTGDAEEHAEQDMMQNGIDLSADVYKAAHHGSRTASTSAFLDAVHPTYAIISCGENNRYGHPHAQTLNEFRARGIQVFRTDEQGTIVATSNGSVIQWNMSPSDSWQSGEPTGSSIISTTQALAAPANESISTTYILNIQTKKFHLPTCHHALNTNTENKQVTTASREQLIQDGYHPCGSCNP